MTHPLQRQTAFTKPLARELGINPRRLDVTFTELRAAKAAALGLTVAQYRLALRRRAWRG